METNDFKNAQAPKGGYLHAVSEKFYEGGQFIPQPDSLGGSKKKAAKKAAKFHYNSVKACGKTVFVCECVRFIASEYEPRWVTRLRAVFNAETEQAAAEIAAALPQYGTASR